jgi:hypothetical protein
MPLPPMAFLPARGAAAETSAWAAQRTVRIEGGDDVYTLTLAPADLAHLRADLGDLRLVDADRRQVPYVLEPRAAAARVTLDATAATARPAGTTTSAWTLTPPAAEAGPDTPARTGLPLADLELTFAEPFFDRQATLLVPDPRGPHGLQAIWQGTLRASRRERAAAAAPQSIALQDLRPPRLQLEVRDGDNAALTLARAEAVVWVPRLTFKAGAGAYRLLLGHREATAPTYDLDALRQDVLAYSAIPIDRQALSPIAANPDYAPGTPLLVARRLERGPVLWTVLGLSIVALIWLTRVILKRPPTPPAP